MFILFFWEMVRGGMDMKVRELTHPPPPPPQKKEKKYQRLVEVYGSINRC